MNAKKIMGAVLVALLAAALFVGAGAADEYDLGTVYTYTDLSAWTSGAFTAGDEFTSADGTQVITVITDGSGNPYFAENVKAGTVFTGAKYGTTDTVTFKLSAPSAPVVGLSGVVNIMGTTIADVSAVKFDAQSSIYINGMGLAFIDEDGVVYKASNSVYGSTLTFLSPGKWGVAALFPVGTTNYLGTSPAVGDVYYFTIAKTAAEITAVADTVNVGENIVLNIQYPGQSVAVVIFDDDSVNYISGQAGVSAQKNDQAKGDYVEVTLGMDGTASVAFEADVKGKAKFSLAFLDANNNNAVTAAPGNPKVTVDIKKGEITAVADEDSYFTGNGIALSGTTTAGSDLFFYIEGQNYPLTQVNTAGGHNFGTAQNPDVVAAHAWFTSEGDLEVENGAWTAVLDPVEINKYTTKKLIAGTYTVIVSTYDYGKDGPKKDTDGDILTMKESIMDVVYGTAAVTLTQPFIENVKANAVAIQELDYEITGTAYSAENINIYIFGTNYFLAAPATVDTDEETFEFTLKGGYTKNMAPGTYFYLIQHPMGDKLFNVWNNETSSITAAENNPFTADYADFFYAATAQSRVDNSTFIFNAYERGTNYAAQALLEEIAGQNIDDIFVQGTFEVEAQKLTINPIPAQVAKGSALTVSGTSNCGEGTEVIVNVLEGTFGATIKGDENAATFLTQKAVTKADGTWEAAIDTTKLKTGTYTVTVELNGQMFDSEAVEIVDKAPVTPEQPTDKPEQPTDKPEQPTEPKTPGFGALAALAGLGAVAVLLLRRE